MYGASDLINIMRRQGAYNNPPTIALGVMTSYNTCKMGDELELTSEQLYLFDADTHRRARTAKIPSTIQLSSKIATGDETLSVKQTADDDASLYDEPYAAGDTVALIAMPGGRYLVLGRIVEGEDVVDPAEQIKKDWSK